jgi:tyrosyl-tRNA synthetase
MTDLFDDLAWRGQIHQETDAEGLRSHCRQGMRSVYCGFDPTAPSLTIGNLVALLLLRRFQLAGHRPIVVVGGGTGLIGDPSGKEAERPVMSPEQVEANIAGQRRIFERILSAEGPAAVTIANNADWLRPLGFLQVLRDVGKHFSVNMMIQKDSVRERLHQREQGISYTEFSYMILQAYDFVHLYDARGVTVQVAGSDQWGNVVAGIDLARRMRQVELFGLTAPLVTRADGGKFGKTEKGAVWLTADRTSPYVFYQFWLNSADADVPRFLKTFTLLPRAEIEALLAIHAERPETREAHRALAGHVTELIHGAEGRAQAEAATQALFSGDVAGLSLAALEEVFAAAPSIELPRSEIEGGGKDLVDVLVGTGAARSKREAREFLSTGAVHLNGERASAETRLVPERLLHGTLALVRRGRKQWYVVRCR